MKVSRNKKFFLRGRKWLFTLALFLLVFAAGSIVKIHAAGNVTGWLWGGGAEPDNALPYDGTNSNVGWISMNNTNPGAGGSVPYGVNIPDGDGPITGTDNYAWSENIGWVSFNQADVSGCPATPSNPSCPPTRAGNLLKGWARIMSIPQAGANAGGWQGWVSLSGVNYGVDLNQMQGTGSITHTYAWSDELGWIDFGQATVGSTCSLRFVPTSPNRKLINESSSDTVILEEVGTNCNCGFVGLASSNPSVANVTTPSPVDFSPPATESKNIAIQTGSVGADANYDNIITATSPSCGSANLSLTVQNVAACSVSCPDSFTIAPDGLWHAYSCTVTGDAGCKVDNCTGGSAKIQVQTGATLNTCEAKADTDARFDTAVSRATAGGSGDETNIIVKPPGWIETNP